MKIKSYIKKNSKTHLSDNNGNNNRTKKNITITTIKKGNSKSNHSKEKASRNLYKSVSMGRSKRTAEKRGGNPQQHPEL